MSDIGARFRALHRRGDPFLLVNAWDAGSARMMESMGAQAVATTSAGHAFSMGRVDGGTLSRDEALAHAQTLAAAVNVPVSGDFENGFAEAPDTVAETIRLADKAGLAGCSIEDTALPAFNSYGFDLAVERIRAASAAARALPRDFVLVARADGVMLGQYDLDEAIRRIRAFEEVGADCVYVPAPPDVDALRRVVASVSIPVNVLAAGRFASLSRTEFAEMGAARLSVGGALSRVAYGAAIKTTRGMLGGDFTGLTRVAGEPEIETLLTRNGGDEDA
ncbi:isocitrate lyase/phosphoenolpyruvate mutase family protein [Roseovarius spongiae]|uniref:Isocitrate lyase/phosphoenolpyruvate mutase family protein n=1 Tax=Roseovarius spongiae TaxID=2320272 RepID=A0A3A8AVH5_9RHOB|nr:isocitrate lyase/phosphoenolpyruvate mutase family protein [Roseovarius spongiae]RKF16263.1 isocitrate lyase/phosphoenolpyruvate mutase family protein [Roseovarius spongiae]